MVGNCSTYLFTLMFWILHSSFSFLDYLLVMINQFIIRLQLRLAKQRFLDLKEVKKLSKLPRHIAFVVLEDQISYTDLAYLVIWCVAAEINNISLFDIHGDLKQNQSLLLTEINKIYPELLAIKEISFVLNWLPHNYHSGDEEAVIVGRDGGMYPDRNGNGSVMVSGNGKRSEEQQIVNIALLAPEDGKQDIVIAAKNIGKKVINSEVVLNEINENLVGENLRSNKHLPDPCILVRLGRTASNVDFLPWQIRLTEIYSIFSHHQVTAAQLLGVLQKFGSCRQRFGK